MSAFDTGVVTFGTCGCCPDFGGGGGIVPPPPWPPPWVIPPEPIIIPGDVVYESMEVIWQWRPPGLGLGNHIEVILYNGAAQPQTGGPNKFKLSPNWSGTITTTTGKKKIVVRMRSDYRMVRVGAQNTQVQPFSIVGDDRDAPPGNSTWEKTVTLDVGPGPQFRQVNFVVFDALLQLTAYLQIGNSWGIHVGWE